MSESSRGKTNRRSPYLKCYDCKRNRQKKSFHKNKYHRTGYNIICKDCKRKRDRVYSEKRGFKKRRKYTPKYEKMKKEDPEKYALIQQERQDKIINDLRDQGLSIAEKVNPRSYKLNNPVSVAKKIENYFENTSMASSLQGMGSEMMKKPTINGLANALGISATTLKGYESRDFGSDPEMTTIQDLINASLQVIAESAEQHLYSKYSTGAMAHLKALQPALFKDKEDGADITLNLMTPEREGALIDYLARKNNVIDINEKDT